MSKSKITALMCLFCLASSSWVSAQEIFEESRNLYSTRELESSAPAATHDMITIRSASTLQGSVKISTSEDNKVTLFYTKKARTDSRSTAIDYIDQIAVSLTILPGGIKLDMRAPNPAPWTEREMGSVDVNLTIPELCKVEIDASYFDIEAEGPFEEFIVPGSLGRIHVTNVTSELNVVTSNRRLQIEDISGQIKAATTNSALVARNVKAQDGQATFRNEGGDIKILGVSGEINVRNSYGRTEIDMFEATGRKSYVKSQYGPIEIGLTKIGDGQLIVTNRYEDIEISLPVDVSAEFSLAVEEDGRIEVYNFPFKPDLILQNRLSLISGEGAALISGSVRGKGDVYVRGYDPEE